MSIPTPNFSRPARKDDDVINLKKIAQKLTDRWPLFLASALICLVIGYIYIIYTPPVYRITAEVLVNAEGSGGSFIPQSEGVADMNLFGGKSTVDNEARVLKTRFLMEQVVREMQLNLVVSKKTGIRTTEVYRPPFKLNFIKGADTLRTSAFNVELLDAGTLQLSGDEFQMTVRWGQPFKLPGIGEVNITPVPGIKMKKGDPYIITISSFDQKVAELAGRLNIAVSSSKETVIDLSLQYPLQQKGEDILNTLITRYRASNIEERNEVADSTIKFIQGRLSYLGSELGDLEGNIQRFRERNSLADMSEQSKLLVANTGEINSELGKTEIQLSVLTDLEKYLKDPQTSKRVLPSSLVPNDQVYGSLMDRYNALLLERDRLLLSVTEESAFVKNLDNQISNLRSDIISNIGSTKSSYVITRNKLRGQISSAEGKIRGVPQTEKNYLVLARQQKIKEELYIFLMEKAEETAISKTSNVSVAKTIDPPKADLVPVSPNRNMILLAALVIGLLLPVVYIIAVELSRTTIASKDDIIELTQAPIFGEINHAGDANLVANNGRSAIAEQFRALRTNLSFYLKDEHEKVVLFTSSMSGEGKSFTAINLANILAMTGKKVLLMEMDLRKPGLSNKLGRENRIGFTNYVVNPNQNVSDLLQPVSENLYLLSSGVLPPNPAEMLMNPRTARLITELKLQFDYLLLDAPPVGIVTDAQLLADYANVTLYLVRHKVTRREQVEVLETLYQEGKMRNLGVVVNDISSKKYGYGYGYGYGYSGEQSDAGMLGRIKQVLKFKK
ncbi:tyrosine-protein kinase [Pedobacter sp. SYP-B3415]|uniref:GumC family protein n=1 Tax=Pedobacter sp. SYP-B3415 TaxID=2496641 RepID=UPI00101C1E63|nr:tyrosine-protein kinase [Pedobacter sp. SYP-B3415]